MEFLLIAAVIAVAVAVISRSQNKGQTQLQAHQNRHLEDYRAEATRWVERLGGQVFNIDGIDDASKQAMADASERYTAAVTELERATTPVQAQLAKDTALEGLYYVRAAREAMGLDPGPELPATPGQDRAGKVTEDRTVEVDGRTMSAATGPSDQTPHYYPGGVVAGRPVPSGWYSEPWWASALASGMWMMSSMMMFNMMFAGMSGVGYSGEDFASGIGEGGADVGDMGGDDGGFFDGGLFGGDGGDAGGDAGGDGGGFFDGGLFGGDGGGDGGGFFDGGLFGGDGGGLFDF
ncbi:DUF1542 domain-containing protein [Dietzia aurantiaca]|uniref:DUF1542 domain-containing protein n=1 Tax=Dietzia aurantiaca TaxID=983873 RepID=A0ABV9PNV2_9ACTN